ncbi:MAG TPA: NAD-dependent epimerase/dehydratase family protein, partial [Elusimicrobiales bacterium]|nr:NAD-dependent epimerase/dehydratase family protein [Elusimicrobiales bacterium]
ADEQEFIRANVHATGNLAKACNQVAAAPKTVVYLSSLAAGGPSTDPARPRDESEPEAPVSAYGRTKLGGEKELMQLRPGIRRVILRAPIVYGPNDSGVSVIAKWVKAGLMLNPGGGKACFSFIFIDDLATALCRAATDEKLSGVYYVSERAIYEWRTFISQMAAAMGRKPPFMISIPSLPLKLAAYISEKGTALLGKAPVFNRDKARESLAGHWICSARRWEQETGFTGWTPLKEGLARTFRQ